MDFQTVALWAFGILIGLFVSVLAYSFHSTRKNLEKADAILAEGQEKQEVRLRNVEQESVLNIERISKMVKDVEAIRKAVTGKNDLSAIRKMLEVLADKTER